MSDDAPNLVLEHLRAIRASQDAMREDIREIKARLDRIERRRELIEERLGLVEA